MQEVGPVRLAGQRVHCRPVPRAAERLVRMNVHVMYVCMYSNSDCIVQHSLVAGSNAVGGPSPGRAASDRSSEQGAVRSVRVLQAERVPRPSRAGAGAVKTRAQWQRR